MPLSCTLANGAWRAGCWPAYARFGRALHNPAATQAAILFRLLRLNAKSAYGRKFSFARLRTVAEFQRAVPIVRYDELTPWIELIKHGEQGVLTAEPVLMFEKSSGSSAGAKYIPYTASLRREFQQAVRAWMFNLFSRQPEIKAGTSYWSITPLAREREITPGDIPVGFEHDAEYFGRFEQMLLEKLLAVPAAVARVADIEDAWYVTLRFLLQSSALTFVSVWNPSFLTILFERLQTHAERLLADLSAGTLCPPRPLPPSLQAEFQRRLRADVPRARFLREVLRREGRLPSRAIWPQLRVISCWTDAAAKLSLPSVRERFDGVEIQGKGLLATEGVVSIPITADVQRLISTPNVEGRSSKERNLTSTNTGCALAVTSHFYEFLESGSEQPKLAHELEVGREYSVLLTTGGGLWRYRLGDLVRVTGFVGRTPLLEFVGKEDGVSDLCGEKLTPAFVGRVLERLQQGGRWQFAMLAPAARVPPHYILFLETPVCPSDLIAKLDQLLRENPHYDYCRRLGQLGAPRLFRIQQGAQTAYLRRCAALGQRAGNVKPTPLHRASAWDEWFERESASIVMPTEQRALGMSRFAKVK